MTPSTASAGKLPDASLPARLDQVQRELAARRASVDRSNTITIVIGLIAVVLLGGYFGYGYVKTKEMVEQPKGLVSFADSIATDALKTARPNLEKDLIASTPHWAQDVSKQIFQSMPKARAKLEETLMEQVVSKMDDAHLLTTQHFQSFLKDNRDLVNANLKELASNEKLSKATLKDLQDALEKSFQSDMQTQAHDVLDNLESLTKRMKRLAANKDLTPEETVERRLVTLVRRMQLEKIDPDLTEPPTSTSAEKETVPVVERPKTEPPKTILPGKGKKKKGGHGST